MVKPMFEVTLDKSGMLLTIRYAGRIDAIEAQRCAEQVKALLPGLKPAFCLLSDLSQLESMALECVPSIERVMDWCDERGVKTVVRLIPDPHKDIGLNIMSLFHYRSGVRIVTCQTMEQAQRALAVESA